MTLRLRKAKGSRPGPVEWGEEDYDVTNGGEVVGRIYRRAGVADDRRPWLWSILAIARTGATTNGIAPTLEEAKQQFSRNWRKYVNPG